MKYVVHAKIPKIGYDCHKTFFTESLSDAVKQAEDELEALGMAFYIESAFIIRPRDDEEEECDEEEPADTRDHEG